MKKEVRTKAMEAEHSALKLANIPEEDRNKALLEAADAIEKNINQILKANKKDIKKAKKLLEQGEYSQALVDRLKLNESKIKSIAKMVRSVAKQEDPLNKTLKSTQIDEGLELYKVSVPIGVIGSIFESRPDVLPQISSLCLKSGNSVILKGGSEAEKSNEILFRIFRKATEEADIPSGWIQLIEARKEVYELLELDGIVDLLIPRGSKKFVRFIQENSKIPVLGHSEGICHVYVDKYADLKKAKEISFDAKTQYPAACNAIETLLVHEEIAPDFLPVIAESYRKAGVEMRGCPKTKKIIKDIEEADEEDWRIEYLDLIISIKIVDSLKEAIDHVNTYGSKHTDSIISEDSSRLRTFMEGVDSSSVMSNASTRFSDGFRYGLGAEVGISTGKIHARGPVGLEGLTTYKYYIVGNGHTVDTYVGPKGKPFTHKPLSKDWEQNK